MSWGDWLYYSTKLWKINSVYIFYLSTELRKLQSAQVDNMFATFSSGLVGYRKELLTVYNLGM